MVDFRQFEVKWQQKWNESHIFEGNPDTKRQKQFITVPYPYMSGPLHLGHGRTYTIADIYVRYLRMKGYNVLWPMAWHITGTPVLGVASRIKENDQETFDLYRYYVGLYESDPTKVEKIVSSFTNPWKIATFFSTVCMADFKRLGYSIDWTRQFTTGDPEYQRFITWQFLTLRKKGYIKKGTYPVLYCTNCKNAVGEDDILQGENAKIVEFTGLKFPYEEGFLVACTLRPETVFGVTNLWVHPDKLYIKAEVDGEIWYIAKESYTKLHLQHSKVKILQEIKGKKLCGKTAKSPIEDRELLILPADFVDPTNATGVVYSVPAHAPFDWVALLELQNNPQSLAPYGITKETINSIMPISLITIEGYGKDPAVEICTKLGITSQKQEAALEAATQTIYKAEFYSGIMKENTLQFAGRKVSEIKDDVIDWLRTMNRVTKVYETDVQPVVCRCGAEVLVGVMKDQWFIDYGNKIWKARATHDLEEMVIIPSKYRTLFESTFNWLHERPCARRRGIGTKLPFDEKGQWIIESLSDSTIYMAFYTIIRKIRENKIPPECLLPPFFDYVLLGQGKAREVSKTTKVPADVLENMRAEFLYWYPNETRHTAISHITNHLSFFIFNHSAIFPKELRPKRITLNEHLILEGKKMSKSKGNVVPLVDIGRKYSADLYRFYVSSIAELDSIVDWRESLVKSTNHRLSQLWTSFMGIIGLPVSELPPQLCRKSLWLLSRINSLILTASEQIESFHIRGFVQIVSFGIFSDLKYYQQTASNIPKNEQAAVLHYVMDRWLRLLSPVIPHFAEELWQKAGKDTFVSLAEWPNVDKTLIDMKSEIAMTVVQNTLDDLKGVLNLIKGKKPTHVTIYIAPDWKYTALKLITTNNLPLTTKDIMPVLLKNPELKKISKQVMELVGRITKGGKIPPFSTREDEISALNDCLPDLEAETRLKVQIALADEAKLDPMNKAKSALPGKPAFFLESK